MSDSFRTLIIQAADAPLARQIAALSPGGEGMWKTGLSPSGTAPATHYVSTGLIPEGFAAVCPEQFWEWQGDTWVMVGETPGDPVFVYEMCQQGGVQATVAEIDRLFADSDVTAQEPFTAFGRLGLTIIAEDV